MQYRRQANIQESRGPLPDGHQTGDRHRNAQVCGLFVYHVERIVIESCEDRDEAEGEDLQDEPVDVRRLRSMVLEVIQNQRNFTE